MVTSILPFRVFRPSWRSITRLGMSTLWNSQYRWRMRDGSSAPRGGCQAEQGRLLERPWGEGRQSPSTAWNPQSVTPPKNQAVSGHFQKNLPVFFEVTGHPPDPPVQGCGCGSRAFSPRPHPRGLLGEKEAWGRRASRQEGGNNTGDPRRCHVMATGHHGIFRRPTFPNRHAGMQPPNDGDKGGQGRLPIKSFSMKNFH